MVLKVWGPGPGPDAVPLPGYKPGEERLERVPPAGEGPSLAPLDSKETWSLLVLKAEFRRLPKLLAFSYLLIATIPVGFVS